MAPSKDSAQPTLDPASNQVQAAKLQLEQIAALRPSFTFPYAMCVKKDTRTGEKNGNGWKMNFCSLETMGRTVSIILDDEWHAKFEEGKSYSVQGGFSEGKEGRIQFVPVELSLLT